MTNDTYTDEQYPAAINLVVHANNFDRCKCGAPIRCEHARAMEAAACAFVATLDPEPAPRGLTDEQVEALREAKARLFGIMEAGEVSKLLAAFPEAFEPGADIPDEVVEAALAAIPWASVHQRADVRAAIAAADAKRAELMGGEQ